MWYPESSDAIEASAGDLNELQAFGREPHLAGEPERDQDVHVREPRDDPGLVADDDVARNGEMGPHRLLERGGERSGERDARIHVSTIWVWIVIDSSRPVASVTRVCHTCVRLPR